MKSISITKTNLILGVAVVTSAVLISSSVWLTSSNSAKLPAAFATDVGRNNAGDDSLAGRIIEDVDRRIDEKLSEFPVTPPPPTGGGSGGATCEGRTATIVGTDGDDNLVGTNGPDVIVALGGFDLMQGIGGNDIICGNDGSDDMIGGDGDDNMFGGDDNDILEGIDSVVDNDHLDGGADLDVCYSDPDPEVNCELH